MTKPLIFWFSSPFASNDSNYQVAIRQRSRGHEGRRHQRQPPPKQGDFVSHDHDTHYRQGEFNSNIANLDSDCDPTRRRSLSPPVGVHLTPSFSPSPEKKGSGEDGYHTSGTMQSPPEGIDSPSKITPETEELQKKIHKQTQREQRLSRVTFPAEGPRLINNSGRLYHQPPRGVIHEDNQSYSTQPGHWKEPLKYSREQSRGDSACAGGVTRRPKTTTTLSSFLTKAGCEKSLTAYMLDLRSRDVQMRAGSGIDHDGDRKLGDYVIRDVYLGDQLKGGNVGMVSDGHICPGSNGQTSLMRGGSTGQMIQQQQVCARFNTKEAFFCTDIYIYYCIV